MKVSVTSKIALPAAKTWELVQRSDTLEFVTKGLIGFRPLNGSFPKTWNIGVTENVQILLFGSIPAWEHAISFTDKQADKMQLDTEEAGGAVTRWDHTMTVKALSDNTSSYTDAIEIEAGLLTIPVWLYAQGFYRYRHWRWKKWQRKFID